MFSVTYLLVDISIYVIWRILAVLFVRFKDTVSPFISRITLQVICSLEKAEVRRMNNRSRLCASCFIIPFCRYKNIR